MLTILYYLSMVWMTFRIFVITGLTFSFLDAGLNHQLLIWDPILLNNVGRGAIMLVTFFIIVFIDMFATVIAVEERDNH